MNGQNVFAGAYVDRSGHLREDPDWLLAAIEDAGSLFVPVWGDRLLAVGEPVNTVLLSRDDVASYIDDEEIIFLGMFRERPAFAVAIERREQAPFQDRGEFHDLRYLGSVVPVDQANLIAHARALVLWNRLQRFCSLCGAPSRAQSGGNTRICTNTDCGGNIFPRVDPAIIVLVSHGDRCLLGRQPSWPEARYSTIAGFVEPGESLEDAVVREVQEETNIDTNNVRYHSSQPWPFPSSLMLGFVADATSEEIRLNDGELEDARWFTRKELRSGFPKLPYRLSIARRLVDDWIAGGKN
ncbi:MAG: NAD(+) diphosphatase [Gammaproteobacteria bacterium]|nr:NAD(+) diphosphatase [Gammaproteobacteria bacterium]